MSVPEPLRSYLRVLLRTPGDRWRLLGLLVLMTLAGAFEALGISLILPFVALLQDPSQASGIPGLAPVASFFGATGPIGYILVAGTLLAVVFLLKNAYLAATTWFGLRFVYRRMTLLCEHLLESYLTRPYSFHVQSNSADLVRSVITDASLLFTAPIPSLLTITVEALTILVVGALLLVLEPLAVPLALLGAAALGYLLQRLFLHRIVALGARAREHRTGTLRWANEALAGIRELQLTGTESFFLDHFTRDVAAQADALRGYRMAALVPRWVLETTGVAGLVLVCAIVSLRGSTEDLIPLLGVLAVAVVRILPSAARIVSGLADVRYYAVAARGLADDLAAIDLVTGARALSAPERAAGPLPLERSIAVRDATFTYPGATRPSLDGVDLEVHVGETVALVGASGAGKTTLADVMSGLLPLTEGQLLVDGATLQGRALLRLQANLGYISQHVYLIDGSLRTNIALGCPAAEIDDARMSMAVHLAQLDALVAGLPGGLDSPVGERGVRLSGGQRQRVGIARALYRNPRFLVLDEATSALDGVTEREVVDALDVLRRDRATLVIAHRLSTIRHCDRIAFMADGRIEDIGTFDELSGRSDRFREMLRAGSVTEA